MGVVLGLGASEQPALTVVPDHCQAKRDPIRHGSGTPPPLAPSTGLPQAGSLALPALCPGGKGLGQRVSEAAASCAAVEDTQEAGDRPSDSLRFLCRKQFGFPDGRLGEGANS